MSYGLLLDPRILGVLANRIQIGGDAGEVHLVSIDLVEYARLQPAGLGLRDRPL